MWKHEDLRTVAQADGVHQLLDFPGVIMTDSGTFQSYVYGDVEVGVDEIVAFQRSIGVDIATMLDVFSRPDMKVTEVEHAVRGTEARATQSIKAAEDTMLNGPIQGGVFRDCVISLPNSWASIPFRCPSHRRVVPVMEQQRYKEYAKSCSQAFPCFLPTDPFTCSVAAIPCFSRCPLHWAPTCFDSAAYALFARDGRLLTHGEPNASRPC